MSAERKVAIVTDSIACLPRQLVEQHDIQVVPINFYAGGRLYRDGVDVSPSEAYELFLKDPDSFKTSAPSPEECLNAYRAACRKGRDIVFVTVSVGLSSVYSVALLAKKLAQAELPGTSVEVIDSRTATPAEGFVALAAARAAESGQSLAEVADAAKAISSRVNAVFMLDTVRHVYRSGRIPKIASDIGSLLNIRPMMTVSEVVHFAGLARSRRHGTEHLLRTMKDKVGDGPVHVAVTHAHALEEAERLRERVSAEFNCAELWLAEFSPVMGYACGTGAIGLAFYGEEAANI